MADMSALATTENYSTLLARIDAKVNGIAQMFMSDDPTNIPAGKTPVRFNTATSAWEVWSGTAWGALASKYVITVDKADSLKDNGGTYRAANTGSVANTIPVRDSAGKLPGSITGDAATVDGKNASDFATVAQGTKADNALPSASYTAADVLTKLKTVDGTGSGLDADTVDGIQGASIITTGNIGSQSVDYADNAGNATTSANANMVGGKSITTTHAADKLLCTGAQGFLATIWGTSLAAATGTVSITGLDGNRDEVYEVLVLGRKGETGLAGIRLRVNGNTGSAYLDSATFGTETSAPIGSMGRDYGVSRLTFWAKSGAVRGGRYVSGYSEGGGNYPLASDAAISYTETAANVTSMTIFLDSGTFAAGTKIIVRRLV